MQFADAATGEGGEFWSLWLVFSRWDWEDHTSSVTDSFRCIFINYQMHLLHHHPSPLNANPIMAVGMMKKIMMTTNLEGQQYHETRQAHGDNDLPELGHDGWLGAAPLVHQLDRRVLIGERETALHLIFWSHHTYKDFDLIQLIKILISSNF